MRFSTMRQQLISAVLGLSVLTVGAAITGPSLVVAQEAKAQEAKAPEAKAQETKAEEVKQQEELSRKAKTRVAPIYPEMARRMSIAGTVKLTVVVAPNGTVRSTKAVGGHPLLVNAAMDAVKQWRFESAPSESSGIVEFKFQPQN